MSIAAIVVILLFIKANYISNKVVNTIKSFLIVLIFINLGINIYITTDHWGKYSFAKNTYKVLYDDLTDLYYNIKQAQDDGNIPVFIDNDLTVRSVRISQYAGAAVIGSDELSKMDALPSNIVFFYFLPSPENYREKDVQLKGWGEIFKSQIIGQVYNNLNLYKVYFY